MFTKFKQAVRNAHFNRRGYRSPEQMIAILDEATSAHLPTRERVGKLQQQHEVGDISLHEYLLLLDAINHNFRGAYDGAAIWRNAAPDECKFTESELKTRNLRLLGAGHE